VKSAGCVLLALVVAVAVLAPWLAPNPPDRQFDTSLYAPPTRLHVQPSTALGPWGTPYIYASRIVSRLERTFEEDRSRPIRLTFLSPHLVSSSDPDHAPLLLFGADS
jgi:hypothetical protein